MPALLALVLAASSLVQEPRGLDVYFIDVDGGAATLLVTPERESVLIDSGWPGRDDRDPKRIVRVLKDVAGLARLDHLVTTHWHMDHYGGVEGLARRVEIGAFWDRGLPGSEGEPADYPDGPKPDDPLGIAYRKASDGKRRALRAGATLPLKGSIRAVVLASGGEVRPIGRRTATNSECDASPPRKPDDPSDNARSLALKFTLGSFDFLDCGDLTWNVERELVCPYDRIGPIDLFQVTHHGMDISNHPTLIRTIAPTVTVMNNGPRKGGSPATARLLKSIPSVEAAYQLHKNASTGPDDNTSADLIANPTPEGGQFIHVAVRPDGSAYTVRFGTDPKGREFRSK